MTAGIVLHAAIGTPVLSNRGWFKAADRRINRGGRPCGSRKAALRDRVPAIYLATHTDRLKYLAVDPVDLAHCLANSAAPWIANLSPGFEIVESRFDPDKNQILLILRCDDFPRIAAGTKIPEFEPEYHGLKWSSPRSRLEP